MPPAKTGLSARGNTGGVGRDIAHGRAHKLANANEIVDTRAATSGRHQKNETGTRTRTLTVVSVTDENTDDTRAETRRTTNVDGKQAAHGTPRKNKIPHLINTAALHLFWKTKMREGESQLEIVRYAIHPHPRGPRRRLLKTMQWMSTSSLAVHQRARKETRMMSYYQ